MKVNKIIVNNVKELFKYYLNSLQTNIKNIFIF